MGNWKQTLGWAALLCLLLAAATAQQKDKSSIESKLIALENAWNQAQLHHDNKALNTLVADTFTYTDYDGTVMNKAQFLADLKDPAYHATLIANEDVRVQIYDQTAVIIGTYHSKGAYKGKAFDHWGRFTDTWVHRDGQWQCVASHTNLIDK